MLAQEPIQIRIGSSEVVRKGVIQLHSLVLRFYTISSVNMDPQTGSVLLVLVKFRGVIYLFWSERSSQNMIFWPEVRF